MSNILTVIPSRLQANRLPGKPLADIAGEPMIIHVWRRAVEAGISQVVVATDCEEIRRTVEDAGGEAIMTREDHASGSDRIFEAVEKRKQAGDIEFVINLQGDLPTLDPELLKKCIDPLQNPATDIATLACKITDESERSDPNVVKAITTPIDESGNLFRALYFTRTTAPYGDGPLYHHIGLYAYRYEALRRFVSLPPSTLERREKLEQLRALEDGMRIDVVLVDTVPLGVDTPADLERARRHFQSDD